jgi:hypothetical protein
MTRGRIACLVLWLLTTAETCVVFSPPGVAEMHAWRSGDLGSRPGRFSVNSWSGQTSYCADDPFGLTAALTLQDGLLLRMENGPTAVMGDPRGVATAPLPAGNGWYNPWVGVIVPTTFHARWWPARRGFPAQWVYHWTAYYKHTPHACFEGSGLRCPLLSIQEDTAWGATPLYAITSGWYVPATGQSCWNSHRVIGPQCDYTGLPTGGAEADYMDDWWATCRLVLGGWS